MTWHGRIRPVPEAFPKPQDGCPRHLLPFPVHRLGDYRAMSKQMAELARRERERRSWFQQAEEILDSDPQAALRLLQEAGRVDVYLPEVERLARRHRELLGEDTELRESLTATLVEAWREKFALPHYERMPERMRQEHEQQGARYIRQILDL
ncbi:MAG: hypothetical protein R6U88_00470 [Candidatus Bipolaricaulota bacterium]